LTSVRNVLIKNVLQDLIILFLYKIAIKLKKDNLQHGSPK